MLIESVGDNVKVNTDNGSQPQNETSIAINPQNPKNLVGGWNDWQLESGSPWDSAKAGFGYSTDGGSSWSCGIISENNYPFQGDPTVASDNSGNLYYCFLSFCDDPDNRGAVYVTKSTNGGASWGSNVAVFTQTNPSGFRLDKPYIATDASGGTYDGSIYVTWTKISGSWSIRFKRSVDGGASFKNYILISDEPSQPRRNQGSVPAVGPNGEVYVSWLKFNYQQMDNANENHIYIRKITVIDNDNISLGSIVLVADIDPVLSVKHVRANSNPTLVVDQNTGYVYVAWTDESRGNPDIFFKRSTDGGAHWGSTIRVNDDPDKSTADQFFPWMTVDPTGKISIVFYDSRDFSSSENKVHLYMAESYDNGASFSANVRITDQPSDPASEIGFFFGDYTGVTGTVGYVHPLWTDSRSSYQDVYTAKITNGRVLSSSSLATAYNNGRRLLRTGSGDYYLTYESNGEIYCDKSEDGSTWKGITRLSTTNGDNKYPSITGTSSKQFAVWQRYNGSTYDTYFAKNTRSGWSTPTIISKLSSLGISTDPLPVISYKTRSGGYQLVVCVKGQEGSNKGIIYQCSNDEGTSWYPSSGYKLSSTSPSHKNPSLSMGPTTPQSRIYLTYDNGSDVYFRDYYTGWSSAENVSSGSGVYDEQYSSVELDANLNKHVVWQGYSLPLESEVIVHRKKSGGSWGQFTIFSGGHDGYFRPSVTGHSTSKASIVWYCGEGHVHRAYYDGSSWSQAAVGTEAAHPGLSAGTTTAKYVWTTGSSSPYEVKLSTETLPLGIGKASLLAAGDGSGYHRSAVYEDASAAALLWVELGCPVVKTTSGAELPLEFIPIPDLLPALSTQSVLRYLETGPLTLPADAQTFEVAQNLCGQGLTALTAEGQSSVTVTLDLVDTQSGATLMQVSQTDLAATEAVSRARGTMWKPISDLAGRTVKLQVSVKGLHAENADLVTGLAEVILGGGERRGKQMAHREEAAATEFSSSYALAPSYPNPFNPTTTLQYQLEEAGRVTLKVYNPRGREVATLVDAYQEAGTHQAVFDASGLPSGVYFCRIWVNGFTAVSKMLLFR